MTQRGWIPLILFLAGLWGMFTYAQMIGGDGDPQLYYVAAGRILGRATLFATNVMQPDDAMFAVAKDHGGAIWVRSPAQMPYRDFVSEYPPAALPLFLIPRLFTDDIDSYYQLFSAEMGCFAIGVGLVAWRLMKLLHPGRLILTSVTLGWTAWVWGAGRLLLHRFDMAVVFVVALAIFSSLRRKWAWTGLCLGVGMAIKIYPVFLLPIFLLTALHLEAHQRRRNTVTLIATSLIAPIISHVILMPWVGLRVFAYFSYHGARGIEIETIWTQLILMFGNSGGSVHSVFRFGCDQLAADDSLRPWIIASYIAMVLSVLSCAGMYYRTIRQRELTTITHRVRLIAITLSVLSLTMLSAKVLSIQYVFWLYPMAMILPGRLGRWIAVMYFVALSIAHVYFPDLWLLIRRLALPGEILVFCRNMLLLCIGVSAASIAIRWREPGKD